VESLPEAGVGVTVEDRPAARSQRPLRDVEIQSRQKKKACDGRGATLGNAYMLIHRAQSVGYAAVCSIQQQGRAIGAPATARRPLDPRPPEGPAVGRF